MFFNIAICRPFKGSICDVRRYFLSPGLDMMRHKALLVTPPTPTRFGPTPPDALRASKCPHGTRASSVPCLTSSYCLHWPSPFAAAVSVSLPLPHRLPLLLRESIVVSLISRVFLSLSLLLPSVCPVTTLLLPPVGRV